MHEEIDLARYAQVIRRQWRVVVAAMLVAALAQVGLSVYNARRAPTYEAFFWIQPAIDTKDVFETVDGLMLLASDPNFQRVALAAAGLGHDGDAMSYGVTTAPLRPLSIVRIGVIGRDRDRVRAYDDALEAELVGEGTKSVENRRQALALTMNDLTAKAQRLAAGNARSTQGLYANLLDSQRDFELSVKDLRPPKVVTTMGGSRIYAPRLAGRTISAAILGLVVGAMAAFLADRRRPRTSGAAVGRAHAIDT